MKNILLLAILVIMIACQQESPDAWSGEDRINFVQNGSSASAIAADTMTIYTFVFEPEAVTTHTIWVGVKIMGKAHDYPRAVRLKQVPSHGRDAVAGVHYVGFDNTEVKEQYIIPAGAVTAQLPIILKRDQLGSEEFQLRIVFEENDYFQLGYNHLSHRTIAVSDRLSKPENWNTTIANYAFGTYSQEKHQFMFDATGLSIDYDYIQAILDTNDASYMWYLQDWFSEKLEEENIRLESENKPIHGFSFYN